MKIISIMVMGLFMNSLFAKSIPLKSEKIFLTLIGGAEGAHRVADLVRTSKTPPLVTILFDVPYEASKCLEWDYEEVCEWVEDRWDYEADKPNYTRKCEFVDTNCVSNSYENKTETRSVSINFSNLEVLKKDDQQVFTLSIGKIPGKTNTGIKGSLLLKSSSPVKILNEYVTFSIIKWTLYPSY